jgi:hypothetical protein
MMLGLLATILSHRESLSQPGGNEILAMIFPLTENHSQENGNKGLLMTVLEH